METVNIRVSKLNKRKLIVNLLLLPCGLRPFQRRNLHIGSGQSEQYTAVRIFKIKKREKPLKKTGNVL